MIYSVRGVLLHKEANLAVVECQGVGYKCLTTMSTVSRLPKLGEEVMLLTYLQVREDGVELFGFFDSSELSAFRMLISVSGVGPKVALSILSDLTPERFALCVASGDAKSLTRGKGVGPKLAQRIVLELKDKVNATDIATGIGAGSTITMMQPGSAKSEAVSALVVLGYAQADAVKAVSGFGDDAAVDEMIKAALRLLAAGI